MAIRTTCYICHRKLAYGQRKMCHRKACKAADNRRRQSEWAKRQKVSIR